MRSELRKDYIQEKYVIIAPRRKKRPHDAKKAISQLKSAQQLNWVQRGPGNVGGRTRALVVDPDDPTDAE